MMKFTKNILLTMAALGLLFLLMEGIFRLLPVNEGLQTQPVNDASPIIHFKPNMTFTWSRFADFSMRNTVRSNNFGFINDQDYETSAKLPLVAVIGDSYVEATMVPYAQTLQGRLAQALKGCCRVYSFGVSGAPLSQYLAFADYARKTFRPEKMVFVIISNDYDESLLRYKNSPGMHYFRDTGHGLELERVDYDPSLLSLLVRKSRLCMYLINNLNITHVIRKIFTHRPEKYVGQTSARVNEERISLSQRGVDAFFRLLPDCAGLPPEDIIFAVDALRPELYSVGKLESVKGSYANIMRNYFLGKARERGYPAIDMTEPFLKDYAIHGEQFEFPQDGHWNRRGHALAAQSILPHIR
jgi:hypothetical protein